jgi:large subunit ribosomal protein L7/L12
MTDEKKDASKPKEADKKEETKNEKQKVEIPEKFQKLIEEIEKMSVIELAELVKVLEKKFGVSAAAPVAVAGAAGEDASKGEAVQEKSEYNVELTTAGDSKIAIIKLVKDIVGIGLKEARDLVYAAPKVIKENVSKEEAEEMKKKLEESGASVELK